MNELLEIKRYCRQLFCRTHGGLLVNKKKEKVYQIINYIFFMHFRSKGPVIWATFFFDLSCNIIALQGN